MDPAVLQKQLDAAKATGNQERVALCMLAGGWNTPGSLMKLREGNAPSAKAMADLFNRAPWRRGADAPDKNDARLASAWAQKQLTQPADKPEAVADKPKVGPKKAPR